MTNDQPRWPAGTPVAPGGKGPGGGRFRDTGGWADVDGDWADKLYGHRFTAGLMTHEQVASYLGRTDYTVFGDASGGNGYVEFREYSDGTRLAHKQLFQGRPGEHLAELETSWIARALGAPTPATVHDPDGPGRFGGHALLMQWFPDILAGEATNDRWGFISDVVVHSDAGHMLGLLDILVGNHDRHPGNVIITSGGPIGIDHGLSFTKARYEPAAQAAREMTGSTGADPREVRMGPSRFAIPLFGGGGTPGNPTTLLVYSPDAIQQARERIEPLRGRLRQHTFDGVMATLDTLERIAVGDQSLD